MSGTARLVGGDTESGPSQLAGEPLVWELAASVGMTVAESVEVSVVATDAGLLGLAAASTSWRRPLALVAAAVVVGCGSMTLALRPLWVGAAVLIVLGLVSLVLELRMGEGVGMFATGAVVSLSLAGLCVDGPWEGAHPAVAVSAAAASGLGAWVSAFRRWRVVQAFVLATDPDDAGRGLALARTCVWVIRDPRGPLNPGTYTETTMRRGALVVRR